MRSVPLTIEPSVFWEASRDNVVIDVRSPGEYETGHIPDSINIPLFDDEERAAIGKLYADHGHDRAVLEGLRIAGPKMASLTESTRDQLADSNRVYVHCWRGGMRSQSMAWLLSVAGFQPKVLEGGYKAFRKLVHDVIFRAWNLMVMSGLTGAGKTRILKRLRDVGEQVCDLEALANHRGSAYGGIAQGAQPTTEQFENDLFACLSRLDPKRRIWVEDEGNRIGRVVVPQPFYDQLRHAPAVFLDEDLPKRVENLMGDYQELPIGGLIEATEKIRKRLGGQHANRAITAIKRGDLATAVEITLTYYDRAYLKAAKKLPRSVMQSVSLGGLSDEQIVKACTKIANEVCCTIEAT